MSGGECGDLKLKTPDCGFLCVPTKTLSIYLCGEAET